MASKIKKASKASPKAATKAAPKAKAAAVSKVKPAAKPKAAAKAAPKAAAKETKKAAPAKTVVKKEGLNPESVQVLKKEAAKAGKGFTKAAPAVALSKILPKEELAASYELADSEVDDFAEDEKAREEIEEIEEDVEGPPEWWKNDPAAIEGADDEAEGEKAEFDDSDEWTEDDEWADDDKKAESDSEDDDRDW